MEQYRKVAWFDESCFLLQHVDGQVCPFLPGKDQASGCTMGRRQAGGGSMMLWTVFCWETVGPTIHVDVTLTSNSYLNIVADHVRSFMEIVFPDGCNLCQQDNEPCHETKIVQEWFGSTTMSLRC